MCVYITICLGNVVHAASFSVLAGLKPQVVTSYRSEWPSSKSPQIINAGERESTNNKCGEKGTFLDHWWEGQLVQYYGEQYGGSLKTKNRVIM